MAATAALPRPLTAACSTMLPTAVMLHCRPMGRPIMHRSAQWERLNRPSSRDQPSIRKFFTMYKRLHTPATAWLMTVASAAPNTPASKARMKKMSRKMFSTLATIKK